MDKSDKVRKNVMSSMRTLARLAIEFKNRMQSDKENCENVKTLDIFDRANWSSLAEAINTITTNNEADEQGAAPIKYGLKNNIYYLLMT